MTSLDNAGPSVVLVHGAYADGSSWSEVIRRLHNAGIAVTAVQNPLTSLADDVAHTRRVLARQPGPVILAGHSFGGTVISEAGTHPAVAALVYVAARAPEAGEDYAALAGRFPAAPASAGLVWADGFESAAIELILPTYGEQLGLRGKICRHWTLNPHPTLIPAIESGWVESVHSFGGEKGMEHYTAARPDVFFTGRDGSLRSNRVLCQLAGQYAIDLFVGSSLQIDADANSSTVTEGRLAGFGGAPNMGNDPHGRRHATPAWLHIATGEGTSRRGRKLVVQMLQTYHWGGQPAFVETLDAVAVGQAAKLPLPPVMIYGDDVSHVVTEEGVAYLYQAGSLEERRDALAAVAKATPIGTRITPRQAERLRRAGLVAYPADLGVDPTLADRSLLAACSIEDLVTWSQGLYRPPAEFRDWS